MTTEQGSPVHHIIDDGRRTATILTEQARLVWRDPKKYIKGALSMWMMTSSPLSETLSGVDISTDPATAHAFQSTYYFFRYWDDVCDKDRPTPQGQKLDACLDGAIASLNSGLDFNDPIMHLGIHGKRFMESRQKSGDNVVGDMTTLLNAMRKDAHRSEKQEILSETDLHASYREQFDPIINLQLIELGAGIRVSDLPDFGLLQARAFALRDLRGDYEKGLVCIPREVIGQNCVDMNEVIGSDAGKNWKAAEIAWLRENHAKTLTALDTHSAKLQDSVYNLISLQLQDIEGIIAKLDLPPEGTVYDSRAGSMSEAAFNLELVNQANALAKKYEVKMQLTSPADKKRFARKIRNLSLAYGGFATALSHDSAKGAAQTASIFAIYDVLSDWKQYRGDNRADERTSTLSDCCNELGFDKELTTMFTELFGRDIGKQLKVDGLERGTVSIRFILKAMGLEKRYLHLLGANGIDRLGEDLQIVDDVLDFEEDQINQDENCLNSAPNKQTYLRRCVVDFNPRRLKSICPHPMILGEVMRRARKKAKKMLNEST